MSWISLSEFLNFVAKLSLVWSFEALPCMVDWLIDLAVDRSIDWLIDWLIDRSIDCLMHQLIDWLIEFDNSHSKCTVQCTGVIGTLCSQCKKKSNPHKNLWRINIEAKRIEFLNIFMYFAHQNAHSWNQDLIINFFHDFYDWEIVIQHLL